MLSLSQEPDPAFEVDPVRNLIFNCLVSVCVCVCATTVTIFRAVSATGFTRVQGSLGKFSGATLSGEAMLSESYWPAAVPAEVP